MGLEKQNLTNGPIFVTGASGFVGSHLTRALVARGEEVHALVRPSSNLFRLTDVLPKMMLHHGDLTDYDSLKKIISKVKPRGVFHLAVSNMIGGLGAEHAAMVATNVQGTIHLMDIASASGFDFFVTAGSFLEYGAKDHPLAEDGCCMPGELYGITKLAGTLYARAKDMPIITLRLFTPYGPWNDSGRLTPTLISSALKNAPIALTRPTISRDFIFVNDIVALFLEAAGKAAKYRGEVFNLGSGVRTPLGEVVSYILKATGSKSEVRWGEFRAVSYDSDTWQADMTKTFSHFSWRPMYPLREGLDCTIEHFKKYSS